MSVYVCRECAASYPLDEPIWRCTCGGLLDLSKSSTTPVVVDAGRWSLWRYRSVLPFAPDASGWRAVTLGEGVTPLVLEEPDVLLKLDFLMPTLSFKDRGSAVLVAKAAESGFRRLIADSSGNAGTSIAAYAARAGIAAEVFVPAGTSTNKVDQLRAYGAAVRQIAGSRQDTAEAAIDRVETSGDFYASHVYNPLFHHGTKTFAYEVWEQMGGRVPGTVIVPTGNGTLLLGVAIGFTELVAAGCATHVPRLVAVQAENCAPVAAAWRGAASGPGTWGPTAAEGIAIPKPARLQQMIAAVRSSDGTFLTVGEEQIVGSRRALRARGIDVEPTAAATWGAWQAWPDAPATPRPVVIALSGAGLKSAPRLGRGVQIHDHVCPQRGRHHC